MKHKFKERNFTLPSSLHPLSLSLSLSLSEEEEEEEEQEEEEEWSAIT